MPGNAGCCFERFSNMHLGKLSIALFKLSLKPGEQKQIDRLETILTL